ncbi:MAG TPA: MlaD family protein [Actinomycetota bacterium]|nr:MlaD family protein [Actinomycetota bacterium]
MRRGFHPGAKGGSLRTIHAKWLKLPVWIKGPIILAVIGTLVFLGVKNSYGGFDKTYDVTMSLPRAGQQLEVGSDVRLRGVVIGKVDAIRLEDRDVKLTLKILDQYRIPQDAQAYITLKTLLGAKYVDLRVPGTFGPPFLAANSRITNTHIGPELEDALADGVNVLDAIRPNDLATVINELAAGARGHGDDVRYSLQKNADLSTEFQRTLTPQLQALHDFRTIFGALRNSGVDLNNLADAINQGVPVYASTKASNELHRALVAITPFAKNLGDLLILNRKQLDRLMDDGDTVLQAVADRPGGLHDLVQGLYRYVYKLSGNPFILHDGSGAAAFTNFIGGDSDKQNMQQICWALPADVRHQVPLCNGGTGLPPVPAPPPGTPPLPIPTPSLPGVPGGNP